MEVTRWAFDISSWNPSKSEWEALLDQVSTNEAERISKFVFKVDAKLSLAGRLLIIKFVTRYASQLGINDIKEIPSMLKRTSKWKPYLSRSEESRKQFFIDFNVSTAGDYVVLAGIAGETSLPQYCIGVDVMKIEIRGKDKVNLLTAFITI